MPLSQAALGAAHAQGLLATPGADPLRTAAIYFNHAAIAIGFAVFFDGMDGAIARLTHTTSDFGKELDSLADVVTFGVAPGILAWIWGFFCLPSHTRRGPARQAGSVRRDHCICLSHRRSLPPGALQHSAQSAAQESRTPRPQVFRRHAHPRRSRLPCCRCAPAPGLSRADLVELHRSGWPTSSCAPSSWSAPGASGAPRALISATVRPRACSCFLLRSLAAIWYFHRYVLFALAVTYMVSGVFFRLTYAFRQARPVPPPTPPQEVPGPS